MVEIEKGKEREREKRRKEAVELFQPRIDSTNERTSKPSLESHASSGGEK